MTSTAAPLPGQQPTSLPNAQTPLTSDHINYLILRYLQEAGHETTATAFYRDWHRGPDFRNPENYPFAGVVERNDLVALVLGGLRLDELEARVGKGGRRFRITGAGAGGGVGSAGLGITEGRADGGVNGAESAAGSRPGSSGKRKGRVGGAAAVTSRVAEEFPTPAPKRQKSGEERVEVAHVNGDAMEIDATTPVADAEVEDEEDEDEDDDDERDADGDAISVANASEPEMTDIPERYDSMDVAVQTEPRTGPKTSTMYFKADKPGAMIYHASFNPSADSRNVNSLLVTGEQLCRFFQMPEEMGNAVQQIQSITEPSLQRNSIVTASTWHPSGRIAAFATETPRDLSNSMDLAPRLNVFSHDCDTGRCIEYDVVETNPGASSVVLALHYSPDGSKLLVLQTSLNRGAVAVYSTFASGVRATLLNSGYFGSQVVDAAWLDNSRCLVWGADGLCQVVDVDVRLVEASDTLTDATKTPADFLTGTSLVSGLLNDRSYEKVRISDSKAIAILSSAEESAELTFCQKLASGKIEQSKQPSIQLGPETKITAIAWQPEPDPDPTQSRFLAVASEDGACKIYAYTHNADTVTNTPAESKDQALLNFYLSSGPALAIAWSSDGSFLAVAGTDTVQIWNIRDIGMAARSDDAFAHARRGSSASPKALVSWRLDRRATLSPPRENGEHEVNVEGREDTVAEPSLSWSADGESLAFAVERQIAVIRFRPPLRTLGTESSVEDGAANGHVSP